MGVGGLSTAQFAAEGFFPHGMFEHIREAFPNAIFEDVTNMLGDLMGLKSPEEVACMERSIAIVEAGLKRVREVARPGVPDFKVFTALYTTMMEEGSEIPDAGHLGHGTGQVRDGFPANAPAASAR